jgi:hypothetical protein
MNHYMVALDIPKSFAIFVNMSHSLFCMASSKYDREYASYPCEPPLWTFIVYSVPGRPDYRMGFSHLAIRHNRMLRGSHTQPVVSLHLITRVYLPSSMSEAESPLSHIQRVNLASSKPGPNTGTSGYWLSNKLAISCLSCNWAARSGTSMSC